LAVKQRSRYAKPIIRRGSFLELSIFKQLPKDIRAFYFFIPN